MRIDSSAPTRIDLAGGTFDIWPLYLFHEHAQTINVATSLRAHCTLLSRRDYHVQLISDDTGETVEAPDPHALSTDRLPLIARLVRHFGARGVDVRTRSDSPVGAGIAGSSAMNVAVTAALAAWTGRPHSDEEILTVAMNVEAQVLGVPTGVQDYRPALYGGVSAIELGVTGVHRQAISTDIAELEKRIVLCYTGASRNSGINNWDVMVRRINGDQAVVRAFDEIRDAASALREALEQQRWAEVAKSIAAEWEARKRLSPGVTTRAIDALFVLATGAGALAGKVCGAGGGGCVSFFIDPAKRREVEAALTGGGARVLPSTLERHGLLLERS